MKALDCEKVGGVWRTAVSFISLEQCRPTELSAKAEILCICDGHRGCHQPQVALGHLRCG